MPAWEDAYMRLEIDPALRVARQIRSARVYDDLAALQQSIKLLLEAMQDIERADYALLQDMRAVRGRNDPEFEAAIKHALPTMTDGFRKLGVLVSTQVGRLQVQRHFPKGSLQQARAFLDEQEALRWLSEPNRSSG
jgi:hypothetical protein